MKSTSDVVIIGGGIQGISLAYHLARAGLTDLCLVEMNTLGSGSSGRSATVTAHSFTTEHCLPLVQLSFDAYMRFQDELGADPGPGTHLHLGAPFGQRGIGGSGRGEEAQQGEPGDERAHIHRVCGSLDGAASVIGPWRRAQG